MLEQFWLFARAVEALFTDSLGYQMGFARARRSLEKGGRARSLSSNGFGDPDSCCTSSGTQVAQEGEALCRKFFDDSTARYGERRETAMGEAAQFDR